MQCNDGWLSPCHGNHVHSRLHVLVTSACAAISSVYHQAVLGVNAHPEVLEISSRIIHVLYLDLV